MVNALPKFPVSSMDNILNYQERKNQVTLEIKRVVISAKAEILGNCCAIFVLLFKREEIFFIKILSKMHTW